MNSKQWVRGMQVAVVAMIGAMCVVAQQTDAGGDSAGAAKFSMRRWPTGMKPQKVALMLKDTRRAEKAKGIIAASVKENLDACDSAEEVEAMMMNVTVAVAVVMDAASDDDFTAACIEALVDACQEAGDAAADVAGVAEDSEDRSDAVGRVYGTVAATLAIMDHAQDDSAPDYVYYAPLFAKAIPEGFVPAVALAMNDAEYLDPDTVFDAVPPIERIVYPNLVGVSTPHDP
ncbi:MAG: hypothetical protein FWF84_08055, partial [Kiritimatiellaeota bacterium]|nr:hypothetical protein [Kiritimatiellota bacterium]